MYFPFLPTMLQLSYHHISSPWYRILPCKAAYVASNIKHAILKCVPYIWPRSLTYAYKYYLWNNVMVTSHKCGLTALTFGLSCSYSFSIKYEVIFGDNLSGSGGWKQGHQKMARLVIPPRFTWFISKRSNKSVSHNSWQNFSEHSFWKLFSSLTENYWSFGRCILRVFTC